ncbi:reverse transcriptase domain-containing protein, partial [Tanacetum coccineum]
LLEQAPRSSEYVHDPMELEDHVPVYIPEPEHTEYLVPAEDEAPIEAYITKVVSAPTPLLPPPSFLSSLIQPSRTRAAMAQMRVDAPSTYHPLIPSGMPPLLPIPLPIPSTSCRVDIPEADMPPQKRLLLTTPRPRCEVGESSAAATRQPGPTMASRVDYSFVDTVETRVRDTERRMMAAVEVVNLRVSHQADVYRRESSEFYSRHHDAQKDRASVRAEIEVLRRERLAYEQESIETRQALARSKAYSKALEARITVLETQAHRLEWQLQDANDCVTRHIMRIQALEAGARDDTLEDTGSSAYGYVSIIFWRTMATVNQGMSVQEIKQIVAQRVTNAIETIAIYEAQTKMARKLLNQAKHQEDKWRVHQARDYRISGPKTKPRPSMAKLQAEVTCYECEELGHYKRDCPLVKFQNCVDKYWKGKARGDSSATTSNINI